MIGCKQKKGELYLIKVIATDLDGTLCDVDHDINAHTAEVIAKAQAAGIRVIIATGRFYGGTMNTVKGVLDNVDLLLNSGAEVINAQGETVIHRPLTPESVRMVYEAMKGEEPVVAKYNGFERNGYIGTREELEEKALQDFLVFHDHQTKEEAYKDRRFLNMLTNCKAYSDIDTLIEEVGEVAKIFCFGGNVEQIAATKEKLKKLPALGIASSFPTNIEITHEQAQKGPALKAYIESLGYTMDEVMVFGDSDNDLSMMEMDFITVAMGNAEDNIKRVSKYVTKSNDQDGVAWAIERLLERQEPIPSENQLGH